MERGRGFFNYEHIRCRGHFLDMISTEVSEYFQFPEKPEQVLFTDPDHAISTSTKHPSGITHLMLEAFHQLLVLIQLEDELARF
jgi:hypothetical protein